MVTQYGRLMFLVTSNTREGFVHLVDMEPIEDDGKICRPAIQARCSCEAFEFCVTRPCRHIAEVCDELAPAIKVLSAWKRTNKKPKQTLQKRQYTLNREKSFPAKK